MQNRFMLVSTCVMVLSSAGCHQARPVTAVVPQSVETALRRALQPLPQQSIRIEEDSAPRVFPNIRFFTAMRVPPFGTGEDTRPDRAAIVAGAMDTILVRRVEDLPSAWAAIRTEAVLDTIHAHDIFLTLLEKTAVIQPAQIVRSADQLRNRYTLLDDTSSVQIIAPPSSRVEDGSIVSRLVTDQRAGVVQYEFVVDRAGRLQVRSQLLARYVTHM